MSHLSMKQVCGLLDRSERTVKRMIQSGEFPAPRQARLAIFCKDDVTSWLEGTWKTPDEQPNSK